MKILAYAHREGRVLVTLDKDFGEMAIVRKTKHFVTLRGPL
jgi:predicted nuclease of predicted toxin-antitoxin system